MRSRYSAFCLKNVDYLKFSWHPKTMPKAIESGEWPVYSSLSIISVQGGCANDKIGKVTFEACYLEQGKSLALRECSRFKRFENRWVYFDGKVE
jgi:SEC-C motif domain protein